MPPKVKTKPWNTSPELMEHEVLYVDYRDENKSVTNNYKFKTTQDRSRLWIQAHRSQSEFATAKCTGLYHVTKVKFGYNPVQKILEKHGRPKLHFRVVFVDYCVYFSLSFLD